MDSLDWDKIKRKQEAKKKKPKDFLSNLAKLGIPVRKKE